MVYKIKVFPQTPILIIIIISVLFFLLHSIVKAQDPNDDPSHTEGMGGYDTTGLASKDSEDPNTSTSSDPGGAEVSDVAASGATDAAFDSTDSDEGESSRTIPPPSVPEFIVGPSCFSGAPVTFSWAPTTSTSFYNVSRASAAAGDTGLLGRYYDTQNLSVPMFTRIDQTVDFGLGSSEYWNLGAPKPTGAPASFINPDTFSVRWTGKIKPPFTGDYVFTVEAKDGFRLFLDEQPLIKNWSSSSEVRTYQKSFTHSVANQTYNLRLEYFNNEDLANIKLKWIRPNSNNAVAPNTTTEIIPATFGGQPVLTPTFNNNINTKLLNAASPNYGPLDIPQQPVSGQINKMIYKNDSTQAGDGLYAEYFDNDDLQNTPSNFKIEPAGATFSLVDSNPTDSIVDYLDPVVNQTVFSATYKGKVLTPNQAGTYTFVVRAKDKVRLYINQNTSKGAEDGRIIDDWVSTGAVRNVSGSITLQANQAYDILIKRSYSGGDGDLDLLWNTPGGTPPNGPPSTNGSLIPKANLFHQVHTTFNAGLQGQYYDNDSLTGTPIATRTDTQVNFLNSGWLPSNSVFTLAPPGISVRWSGKVKTSSTAGLYSFKIVSTGQGTLMIDKKTAGSFSSSGTGLITTYIKPVQLDADQLYDIKLEFKDTTANPRIEMMYWKIDTGADAAIPAINLTHNNVLLKSDLALGLMGRYFDNIKNTGHVFSKVDDQLNFSYGTNPPPVKALGQYIMNPDTFTVLWGGKVKAGNSIGDYDFLFSFNDGIKAYGDKKSIAKKYGKSGVSQTQSAKGKINMKANKTSDLRVDYVEHTVDASMNMNWQPPSAAATPIPIGNMLHGRINAGSITYQDNPPTGGYLYQVTAVGSGGNTSSVWFPVDAGSANCNKPVINPVVVACDETNPNQHEVRVSWAPVTGASNYRVYRTDIGLIPAASNLSSQTFRFDDQSVTVGSNYTYYLEARVSGSWTGVFSDQATTSTPVQACGGGPVITFTRNQCYTTGLASQTGSWIQTGTQPIQFSVYDPVYTLNDATAKYTLQRNPSAPTVAATSFTTGFIYPPASPFGNSRTFGRNFAHSDLSTLQPTTSNQFEMTASICNNRVPQRPEDCASVSRTFDYLANCIAPWIQTQDGGIHSNDSINFSTSGP